MRRHRWGARSAADSEAWQSRVCHGSTGHRPLRHPRPFPIPGSTHPLQRYAILNLSCICAIDARPAENHWAATFVQHQCGSQLDVTVLVLLTTTYELKQGKYFTTNCCFIAWCWTFLTGKEQSDIPSQVAMQCYVQAAASWNCCDAYKRTVVGLHDL